MVKAKETNEIEVAQIQIDPKSACDLLSDAFQKKFTESNWIWKHEENPAGKSKIYGAMYRNTIAGLRPLWFINLFYKGEKIKSVQCVDAAVSYSIQGRGIFRKMTEAAFNSEKDLLAFTNPNQNSYPAYMKFGWSDVGGLHTFIKPTSLLSALKYFSNLVTKSQSLNKKTSITKLPVSDGIFESLPKLKIQRILDMHNKSMYNRLAIEVNYDWIEWRTKNPSGKPYYYFFPSEEKDFLLIFNFSEKAGLKGIRVIDILADYNSEKMVTNELNNFTKKVKKWADFFSTTCTQGHPAFKILQNAGFIKIRKSNFVVNRNNSVQIPSETVRNPKSWALMISAFDSS